MSRPAAEGGRPRPSRPPIVVATCLLLARGLLTGALLFFAFYVTVVATRRWRDDAYWQRFPPDFGCDDTRLLDKCASAQAAGLVAAPTTATLAAVLLVAAGALLLPSALPPLRLRLAAQKQLPPSAFFSWWCGGLSASDAALVAGVLIVNAAWALSLGGRYKKLDAFFAGGGSTPGWMVELMLVAIALGQMLFPNLALLFFPIARGSPLLAALGISYPSAVRLHRWLGHWTMALASAHSVGFWGVWLLQGKWLEEALQRGARVNNLAGGASFLGGLALWLTSLEWARRRNYALFIALHHVGWWVFFLAGCAHYSPLVWYFAPGLMLYFCDAAFRVWSNGVSSASCGGGSVLALEVAWEEEEVEDDAAGGKLPSSSSSSQPAIVAAIVARAPAGFAAADAGIVWARCPAVSAWQWHPFEYLLVDGGGSGGSGGSDATAPAVLAMHVKAYGRWTRAFAKAARDAARSGRAAALDLRLEAPYGEGGGGGGGGGEDAPHAPSSSSSSSSSPIVVLAGGIGATAALTLLRELEREAEAHGGADNTSARRPMLFVWTCRHAPELAVLLPRLADAAARAGVDLDARLFYTGRGGLAALAPGAWGSAAAVAAGSPAAADPLHLATPPAAAASSQCPVLAPGRWALQLAQRLSAHLLACAGATAALLAVRLLAIVQAARAGRDPWTTAQTGLASAVGLALGAAVPALVVIVVARVVMVVLPRRAGGADGKEAEAEGAQLRRPLLAASAPSAAAAAAAAPCTRVRFVASASGGALAVVAPAAQGDGGAATAGPLAELPLALGRPASLRALVADWLDALKQVPSASPSQPQQPVELFAMGPDPLVAEARALCADAACVGRPMLFRLRTHEL